MHARRDVFVTPWLVVLAAGFAFVSTAATLAADDEKRERDREHGREHRDHERDRPGDGERADLRRILQGLEHGIHALERLGRHEDVERLRKIATRVRSDLPTAERRGEARRPRDEHDVARRQLEVFRLAHHALREAERGDEAEALMRAIRAREVVLERRRGAGAEAIRERSPGREQQVKLLRAAHRVLREMEQAERAAAVATLARQLSRRESGRPDRARDGERREHRDRDRDAGEHRDHPADHERRERREREAGHDHEREEHRDRERGERRRREAGDGDRGEPRRRGEHRDGARDTGERRERERREREPRGERGDARERRDDPEDLRRKIATLEKTIARLRAEVEDLRRRRD